VISNITWVELPL